MTRGMKKVNILLMWSPIPLLPPPGSKIIEPEDPEGIVNSGSQKNFILAEVCKWLGLLTTPYRHPYIIRGLHQGRYLWVNYHCFLPYNIKPFTNEVLCDVSRLEIFDVLLSQPYLWKCHVVYKSSPHNVIIYLANKLYRILEVALPTAISLISAKKCSNIIFETEKFIFFMIHPQIKANIMDTSMAPRKGSPMQQK